MVAQDNLGRPYIWGGDDPGGFDCSGLVCECLRSVGLLGDRERLSAHGLMTRFAAHEVEFSQPDAGCLLFRMRGGHAIHVTALLDRRYHIGASGGDSSTTTPTESWAQNAFVKLRPLPNLISGVHLLVDPFRKEP